MAQTGQQRKALMEERKAVVAERKAKLQAKRDALKRKRRSQQQQQERPEQGETVTTSMAQKDPILTRQQRRALVEERKVKAQEKRDALKRKLQQFQQGAKQGDTAEGKQECNVQ